MSSSNNNNHNFSSIVSSINNDNNNNNTPQTNATNNKSSSSSQQYQNIFSYLKMRYQLLDNIYGINETAADDSRPRFFPYTILSIFRHLRKKSQNFLFRYLFLVRKRHQGFELKLQQRQQYQQGVAAATTTTTTTTSSSRASATTTAPATLHLTPSQKKQQNYQILLRSILLELHDFRILTKLQFSNAQQQQQQQSQEASVNTVYFEFCWEFMEQLRKVILQCDLLKKVPLVKFHQMAHEYSDTDAKEKLPSKKKLEKIAKEKWEHVLHYMVGAVNELKDPSIVKLLRQSSLIQDVSEEEKKLMEAKKSSKRSHDAMDDDDQSNVRITNQGFQFLLQDTRTQIWQIFKQYLMTCEERNQNPEEVIEFLFRLSFMEAGQPIELSSLSDTELNIVKNLAQFGIVHKKKKLDRLYPTQLASGLLTNTASVDTSSTKDRKKKSRAAWGLSGKGGSSSALDGYIIVETNFRVYAYTTSALQIQLLSLFVELETRLPNIISGTITRDSVRASLINGITADQIISYLAMHAHPEMKKSPWFVPPNIVDQMRLWERERERITGEEADLYDSFASFDGFSAAVKFAEENDWLLYQDDDKLILVVKEEGSERMKDFMRQNLV